MKLSLVKLSVLLSLVGLQNQTYAISSANAIKASTLAATGLIGLYMGNAQYKFLPKAKFDRATFNAKITSALGTSLFDKFYSLFQECSHTSSLSKNPNHKNFIESTVNFGRSFTESVLYKPAIDKNSHVANAASKQNKENYLKMIIAGAARYFLNNTIENITGNLTKDLLAKKGITSLTHKVTTDFIVKITKGLAGDLLKQTIQMFVKGNATEAFEANNFSFNFADTLKYSDVGANWVKCFVDGKKLFESTVKMIKTI